jgi:hypothetical protein
MSVLLHTKFAAAAHTAEGKFAARNNKARAIIGTFLAEE